MKRVLLEPAYVLHRRLYRESSLLVELFSQTYGRVSVVAKGVRRPHSFAKGLLEPFIPLIVSFAGRGELMTLSHVEVRGEVKPLSGECLFAGFYLNELLMCLMQKWDPHPKLYSIYTRTCHALHGLVLEQKVLRGFEKSLLEELGYGPLRQSDHSLEGSLHPDKYYRFTLEHGFVLSELDHPANPHPTIFLGKSLLAIAREDWQDEEVLQAAKRLNRLIFASLLGARPLYSRQLFIKPSVEKKDAN